MLVVRSVAASSLPVRSEDLSCMVLMKKPEPRDQVEYKQRQEHVDRPGITCQEWVGLTCERKKDGDVETYVKEGRMAMWRLISKTYIQWMCEAAPEAHEDPSTLCAKVALTQRPTDALWLPEYGDEGRILADLATTRQRSPCVWMWKDSRLFFLRGRAWTEMCVGLVRQSPRSAQPVCPPLGEEGSPDDEVRKKVHDRSDRKFPGVALCVQEERGDNGDGLWWALQMDTKRERYRSSAERKRGGAARLVVPNQWVSFRSSAEREAITCICAVGVMHHHLTLPHPSPDDALDHMETPVFRVEVSRGWNSRLGFSLMWDPLISRTVVKVVHPDTPAAKLGKLAAGDAILQVNDHDVTTLPTPEVIDILRKSKGKICLIVERRPMPPQTALAIP
ncbi:unnamed protein product [Cyprideis torosa]|uniref:Uncharacterized protein n=1 Tax=Cyprideis torosa TaxID=163714 RepID=A0A7R8ZIT1_9CRUS|nr:unnamed protein product [Cyprideis torosa]CAG0880662.1 unnamed protein product [Cyprideis torosa]